jgi:tetratricopeptide (TPR) repeat protein
MKLLLPALLLLSPLCARAGGETETATQSEPSGTSLNDDPTAIPLKDDGPAKDGGKAFTRASSVVDESGRKSSQDDDPQFLGSGGDRAGASQKLAKKLGEPVTNDPQPNLEVVYKGIASGPPGDLFKSYRPVPVLADQGGAGSAMGAGLAGGLGLLGGDSRVTSALNDRADREAAAGNDSSASLFNAFSGRTQQAEPQAQRALANNPNDTNALAAMMMVRQSQGRGDEARALARRTLALDPSNPVAKLIAGADGNLDKGAALQKKFGHLDLGKTAETDSAAGGLLGLFGGRAADGESRAGVAEPGARQAGAPPQAANGGLVHPAAPVYDLAQPLTPAQQLVLRAVHKHEIGDEQGAMLALTEAIDRDPQDAGAFVVRAEVDNSLTKYAAAILDATKAVDLAPTKPVLSARALRARAYANLELKQWVQALADASRAVDQDPRSGLGYLYRAMAEDKLGRGTAASADLADAVKLDPALTPLAAPLMIKYGLRQAPSKPGRRSWPVLFVFVGGASVLLAYGLRKLLAGPRLTTTASRPMRQTTPVP